MRVVVVLGVILVRFVWFETTVQGLESAVAQQALLEKLRVNVERAGGMVRGVDFAVEEATGERFVVSTRRLERGEEVMRVEVACSALGREILGDVEANEEQLMAAWLLEARSRGELFVQVLPGPEDLEHMPVYWDDATVAMLEGSETGDILGDRRRKDDLERRRLAKKCSRLRDLADADSWRWAMTMVRSRAFDDAGAGGDAMAPLVDMFNHRAKADGANCDWEIQGKYLVVTCLEAVAIDTELCFSYGTLSPTSCLLNYGFVVDDDVLSSSSLRLRLEGFEEDALEAITPAKRRLWTRDEGRYGDTWDVGERRVRIGFGTGGAAATLLSLVRVAVATDNELRRLLAHDDESQVAATLGVDPVSWRNERAALAGLDRCILAQLAALPTTLADDVRRSRNLDLKPNVRNAAHALAHEKLVLYHWRTLARQAAGLLDRTGASFDAGLHYADFVKTLFYTDVHQVPDLDTVLSSTLPSFRSTPTMSS